MEQKPRFAPNKSLVDAPFFSELSKFKLDNAKLDSKAIELTGFLSLPLTEKKHPTVRLTSESFSISEQWSNSDAQMNREVQVPGILYNTNTIEEFRDLDKIRLLKSRVEHLRQQIVSGDILQSPELLTSFFLLTFADLKKYKFYYWFMFPSFKWTSMVKESALQPSVELDNAMSMFKNPVAVIEDTNAKPLITLTPNQKHVSIGVVDYGSFESDIPWHLRNLAALLSVKGIYSVSVYLYRRCGGSRWIDLDITPLTDQELNGEGAEGWERNASNKLVPKFADLSSLMNPLDLADQAIDLNLKLMKWRAAPEIDLKAISSCKCLLLGAGTLGSYIARGLMAWGVRHITFVDSGKVSYSNPVRQPLYTHDNCIDQSVKAEAAAEALGKIFPGISSRGYNIEIPMAGHSITNEERQKREYDQLVRLIEEHDAVFLLMDSRESRWLPTIICQALGKLVINVAIGFDSYLVMRHGVNHNLGCYYCNDVVAPKDSISRQSLDQMCTVTRPGCAMMASGLAVELLAQVLQHPDVGEAPANADTVLGPIPHQMRGFLSSHEIVKIWGPAFPSCSACGPSVNLWKQQGWDFVVKALNDPHYVTESSGLGELQRRTDELELDSDSGGELD